MRLPLARIRLQRERAPARLVAPASGHAAHQRSNPRFDLVFSPGTVFPNNFYSLSRVEPQRDCDAPVTYGALEVSVISRRTQSSYLCVVVGLVVHVWCVVCACVRWCVRACLNRCYSCTQMRGVKKKAGREAARAVAFAPAVRASGLTLGPRRRRVSSPPKKNLNPA